MCVAKTCVSVLSTTLCCALFPTVLQQEPWPRQDHNRPALQRDNACLCLASLLQKSMYFSVLCFHINCCKNALTVQQTYLTRVTASSSTVNNASTAADLRGVASSSGAVGRACCTVTQASGDATVGTCEARLALAC